MVGGRSDRGSRRHVARAASVVVPFPRGAAGDRPDLGRFVPSGRSLLVAVVVLTAALGLYWAALASSVFAVERVEVRGASGPLAKEVERVTGDVVGQSLLEVDAAELADIVRALPGIAGVAVDRAFPHTLVVKVAPERPVAVARQGSSAWLVTSTAKVIQEIERGTELRLPRIWLTRDVEVAVGRTLPSIFVAATRAVASVREVELRRRVKSVRLSGEQVVVVLHSGPELRLGDPTDVVLKLAVAARVLPLLTDGTVYLDVSVPERPVASRYFNS